MLAFGPMRPVGLTDPRSLGDYLANDGYRGLTAALQLEPAAIVESVTASGLRGPLRDLLRLAHEWLSPTLISTTTHELAISVAFPGLAGVLYGLAQASIDGGFGHATVIVPLVAGAALIAGFAWHALRTPAPLIDLRLLRARAFSAASATVTPAGRRGWPSGLVPGVRSQ